MKAHDVSRALRAVRRSSVPEVSARLLRRAAATLDGRDQSFPLRPEDIAWDPVHPTRAAGALPGRPLTIGWVMAPPAIGSGGHTTAFRMVRALEAAGHRCVVVLYDRNGVDLPHYRGQIRAGWPWIRADVISADDELPDLDACVATGWPSAHVVAARGLGRHAFYFIQDYEPFFHPRGFEYELAVQSYRLGLTNIALGEMVRNRLASELGLSAVSVPFSCDTDRYFLQRTTGRSGVVCYLKPGAARRGFLLDVLALERFHAGHPGETIHVYGDTSLRLPFPHVNHGKLSPQALADLYNTVAAGLAMSFTNISLVAEEMLACGVIPVVNDSADARADVVSPYVRWCLPHPERVAAELAKAAVHSPGIAGAASRSVRRDNWSVTASGVRSVIEEVVFETGTAALDMPTS